MQGTGVVEVLEALAEVPSVKHLTLAVSAIRKRDLVCLTELGGLESLTICTMDGRRPTRNLTMLNSAVSPGYFYTLRMLVLHSVEIYGANELMELLNLTTVTMLHVRNFRDIMQDLSDHPCSWQLLSIESSSDVTSMAHTPLHSLIKPINSMYMGPPPVKKGEQTDTHPLSVYIDLDDFLPCQLMDHLQRAVHNLTQVCALHALGAAAYPSNLPEGWRHHATQKGILPVPY